MNTFMEGRQVTEDIRTESVQYNDWLGTAAADGLTNFELEEALGIDREQWFVVYLRIVMYSNVQAVRAWAIEGTYEDLEAQARDGQIEVTRVADINFESMARQTNLDGIRSTPDFIARVFERFVIGLQWSKNSLSLIHISSPRDRQKSRMPSSA